MSKDPVGNRPSNERPLCLGGEAGSVSIMPVNKQLSGHLSPASPYILCPVLFPSQQGVRFRLESLLGARPRRFFLGLN